MIWVPDRTTNNIRRFSASGEYLGKEGGNGEGPGEFSYLLGFKNMPDGRMAAWIEADGKGEIKDTIPIPSRDTEGTPSGAQYYLFAPMSTYGHKTHNFLLPNGTFVVGRNDEYVFHSRLNEGRVLRIECDSPPGLRARSPPSASPEPLAVGGVSPRSGVTRPASTPYALR